MRTWKVGELARRTGLTVRTLHHWDAVGLLRPARRSGAGYRLYDAGDLARLQQILSLRQLGFSLEEIREVLTRPELSLPRVLRLHAAALRDQIAHQRRLCERLEGLAERLDGAETVSAEDLFQAMEAITMFEKYYTPEQLERLAERRRQLGDEAIRAAEVEWPELMAAVRSEMDKGTDPASETVQRLARRWQELVQEFTGGDPGIAASLRRMVQEEPAARERTGLDPELSEYVGRALGAAGQPSS